MGRGAGILFAVFRDWKAPVEETRPRCDILRVRARRIVIQSGTPGDSLYVILSGSAKARGKPAARTLWTGDYFGELGLFGDAPRSATVVATDELHVMRLPCEAFLRLAEHDPAISFKMLSNLGSQIRRLEAQAA